ncbi:hypothetical protein [Dyadobacter luticola]|uniref:Uncharacterized protein n=1 Tax=Dyadobacter luticola TaxID=1979387 RepID=A0A5R9KUN5_9BACT|nr:hypothetical protein [Dyadobacter luticola]TLV00006.1 hypothetical protein FEN17_10855 [Dyadobacter luticola]
MAIVLIFLYTLFKNAQNTPSFDDYDTTLNFIRRFYFDNNPINVQKDILLSRHNEHRIVFSKAAAAIYFYIFHEINFRHLILFQNILLIAFFGLLLVLLKQKKLLVPETVLLSAAFLFSLGFWQVTFYYWGGIQHYTVFFCSFLCLFLLNQTTHPASWNFLFSVIAATVGVISFGNGFLALFLGGFLLAVHRRWKLLAAWTIIGIALLTFTFFYQPPAENDALVGFNVEWMARLLFTFLGSFLYINPGTGQNMNILVCMLAGLLVFLTWIWLFFKGYAFKNPLLYSLFSLPVLTAIIVAISRFETKAAGGIAPRYMFFTATIPVFLILILMDLKILKTKHLQILGAFAALIWAGSYYYNVRALEKSNTQIAATLRKWEANRSTSLIDGNKSAEFSEILTWAVDKKVVTLPGGEVVSR